MQYLVGVNERHSTAYVTDYTQSLSPFHVRSGHMQNHVETATNHILTEEGRDFL